ncbi:hypothetical protein ACSLPA_04995, partial [Escherichia coli]
MGVTLERHHAVLATRLTEDPNTSVLLLEAGGPDYRFD